jgi:hypothetical protein
MLKYGGHFALTQYLHLVVVLASIYRTVDGLDVRYTQYMSQYRVSVKFMHLHCRASSLKR